MWLVEKNTKEMINSKTWENIDKEEEEAAKGIKQMWHCGGELGSG